ncbi:MAG TPA: addiction module protein, partial [Desulfurivibrionaceae bacterium]|nr:addiction module protein [Desulfurivibrionaceae bacterium]
MTATAEQILKQALGLPPIDRAELIERLFQSFDQSADRRVDAAWSGEIESRIDAYDEGKITASAAEDVMARINRR